MKQTNKQTNKWFSALLISVLSVFLFTSCSKAEMQQEDSVKKLIEVKNNFKNKLFETLQDKTYSTRETVAIIANALEIEGGDTVYISGNAKKYLKTINDSLEVLVLPEILPDVAVDVTLTEEEKVLLAEYIASIELIVYKIDEIGGFSQHDAAMPPLAICKAKFAEEAKAVCMSFSHGGMMSLFRIDYMSLFIEWADAWMGIDVAEKNYYKCVAAIKK